MKTYPSIPKEIRKGIPIYAYAKYDGSCLRAEWTRKKGFEKFGRRGGLLDDSNPILKRGPDLFMGKYAEGLDKVFRQERWEKTTCYFEFFGPSSFAGNHKDDEQQDVVLFDVNVYKKGFLEPAVFNKLLGHMPVQELLYHGNATEDFIRQVREGTLPGMPLEGVICKGALDRKAGMPLMFKVKSEAWLSRLKEYCKGDEALFNLLS